ncbi:MAG: type II toxin-antitoxin system HicB family antitoxin [Synergistaceae bacterium]|jgi:predicted RNase H-like HicB family nuclease|nr:type II toxin-antitoxin system HicB family antitoxin [Synergistaceae bacterium]
MKYYVLIHNDGKDSCWGECPELPGCFSHGDTPDELMSNMKEAIALYLENDEATIPDRISEIRELIIS